MLVVSLNLNGMRYIYKDIHSVKDLKLRVFVYFILTDDVIDVKAADV